MDERHAGLDPQAVIDLIYEAALLPDLWPVVLEHLSDIAGGAGTILLASDTTNLRWINSPGLDGFAEDFISGGWGAVNTRTPKVLAADHAGFILEEDVYTTEEFAQDVIVRDFLRPRGLGWATATALSIPTGDTLVFSIERRHADGPVPRAAVRVLDGLRPHLARSALLSARLKLERARAAVEALALIGLPAATLRHDARLQTANGPFSDLVPRVVVDRRDRIGLADPGADALLARSLAAGSASPARSIPVPATDADPAMVAHLVPMRGGARDIFAGSAVILVLTPVLPAEVPGAKLLQGLFDLTAAEARVARGIGQGATVAALAIRHGVTSATIRSQLKATFAKTGIARQADLVRLLAGLSLNR